MNAYTEDENKDCSPESETLIQEFQTDGDTTGHNDEPQEKEEYICGTRKKTVVRTSVCIMSLGLSLITIATMVLVLSLKTKYWEDTPLQEFSVFILICGVVCAVGGAVTLVRMATAWRQNMSLRRERRRRLSNISTLSDYVESRRGSTYNILESFPPLDRRRLSSSGFIEAFFQKIGQPKERRYLHVPATDV